MGRVAAGWLRPRRAADTAGAASTAGATPAGAVRQASLRAGRHLLSHVGRILRRLGLQLSGVVYFVFALGFGAEGVKRWRHDHAALGPHTSSITTMAPGTGVELGIALVFIYFGLTSLARAMRH